MSAKVLAHLHKGTKGRQAVRLILTEKWHYELRNAWLDENDEWQYGQGVQIAVRDFGPLARALIEELENKPRKVAPPRRGKRRIATTLASNLCGMDQQQKDLG